MDFEEQLSTAMRATAVGIAPPVNRLVTGSLEHGRALRRRAVVRGLGAALAVLLVAGGGFVVTSALRNDETTVVGTGACHSVVRDGVLPSWARAGFSDARPRIAHVRSAKGEMVAILFGPRLSSPPAKDVNNKILWVSRAPEFGPLLIDATLSGTGTHVRRAVDGGPGPSTIDLPQPGCWRMQLSWGSHRDSIDLVYAPG